MSLQTCATPLNSPADCVRSPSDTFETQMAVEQQVADETGARAIDPEQWFCLQQRCPTIVGATPVYGDGVHMTAEYASLIAPEVVAAIQTS
jgi:hypothetical protein